MRIRLALVTLLAIVAGAIAQHSVVAQPASSAPLIVATARAVSHSGTSFGYASGDSEFVPGSTSTKYLFAGDLSRGDVCSFGTANPERQPLTDLVSRHPHVWSISATPVRAENGAFEFTLEWTRYDNGSLTSAASGRHELTLPEGERHVLDLLRVNSEHPTCRTGSIVLDVEARMRDSASQADRLLRYDLWLQHIRPDGTSRSHWMALMGRHGVELPFAFAALQFPLPQLVPDQFPWAVTSRVDGQLRGRINGDGSLDIDLQAHRRNRLERADTTEGPTTGFGRGRMQFRVVPGEAIEIELPSGIGMVSVPATRIITGIDGTSGTQPGNAPAAPVSLQGNALSVSFEPFFQGHKVALLLQPRIVE